MTIVVYQILSTLFCLIVSSIGMSMGISKTRLKKAWHVFFTIIGGYLLIYSIYHIDFIFEFGALVWEDRENVAKINNPAKAIFVALWPVFGILFGGFCAYFHLIEIITFLPVRSDKESSERFFAVKEDDTGCFCKMAHTPDGGAIAITWDAERGKWVADRASVHSILTAKNASKIDLLKYGVTAAPEIWEE